MRKSAADTETLKDLLAGFGVERSDLKTMDFSIDAEYESYKDRGIYKQRFVGYKFHHLLKVDFESDNGRLGRVLSALANAPVKPEIRISYTVKDQETAKNELLGKAVSDAMKKASVLTEAANVALKKIQSIDYSWGEINFEVQPLNRMLVAKEDMEDSSDYALNIQPDDIEVSDTVTLVWEIV